MQLLRFVFLVAFLFPIPAMAQGYLDSWDNLGAMRVGQKIQLVRWDMKALKGTFASYSADSISVRKDEDGDVVLVPRAIVFKVLDRERSKRSRNMLIGMSIGVGAGVAMGLATKAEFPLPVPLGLFFAATAAGVGAGAAIPSYPVIYRATKKPGSN